MCGGVRFAYDPALEPALAEHYPSERLAQFRQSGVVESLFWQASPVLPAIIDGAVSIVAWGNRDSAIDLPRTGWVRAESLAAGRWRYLHPLPVVIPVHAGVEKKVWFRIEHGIQGILVRRGDLARVYMLTVAPTPAYRALTGHDRMPALIDQPEATPLSPAPTQATLDLGDGPPEG